MSTKLGKIAKEVALCRKCRLWKSRTRAVPGEGNTNAKIMLIGEAAGREEDLQGRPFVGRAGKLLDELLKGVGIKREEVFIANVIKCRPPNNRTPRKDEIKACFPYLERQIKIIKPRVIGCLGNSASAAVMKRFGLGVRKIGAIHGKIFRVKSSFGALGIVPLYHPAFAIYNARMKNVLKKDFNIVAKYK